MAHVQRESGPPKLVHRESPGTSIGYEHDIHLVEGELLHVFQDTGGVLLKYYSIKKRPALSNTTATLLPAVFLRKVVQRHMTNAMVYFVIKAFKHVQDWL